MTSIMTSGPTESTATSSSSQSASGSSSTNNTGTSSSSSNSNNINCTSSSTNTSGSDKDKEKENQKSGGKSPPSSSHKAPLKGQVQQNNSPSSTSTSTTNSNTSNSKSTPNTNTNKCSKSLFDDHHKVDIQLNGSSRVSVITSEEVSKEDVVINVSGKKEPVKGTVWKDIEGIYTRYICFNNGVEYKPGDSVYIESQRADLPFFICSIQEFKRSKKDTLMVHIRWFYRPCEVPETVYQLLIQDRTALVENGCKNLLDPELCGRELFISEATDVLPVSQLRGLCRVDHFSELSLISSFRPCSDSFFYVLGYNPETRRLASTQGEIRVGPSHQARLPDLQIGTPVRTEEWEEICWRPGATVDADLVMYLRAARSMAAFAGMCNGGSPDDGCLAASRDDTTINALTVLHDSAYDPGRALQALVKCPVPKGIDKKWSEDETKKFVKGLRQFGKNFFRIRKEYLPFKETGELVEFYYLWKKTPGAVPSRTHRRHRRQSVLRRIRAPRGNSRSNKEDPGDLSSASEDDNNSEDDSDSRDQRNYHCRHCFSTTSKDWHHGGKEKALLCTDCRLYFKKYGELPQLDGSKEPPYLFRPVIQENENEGKIGRVTRTRTKELNARNRPKRGTPDPEMKISGRKSPGAASNTSSSSDKSKNKSNAASPAPRARKRAKEANNSEGDGKLSKKRKPDEEQERAESPSGSSGVDSSVGDDEHMDANDIENEAECEENIANDSSSRTSSPIPLEENPLAGIPAPIAVKPTNSVSSVVPDGARILNNQNQADNSDNNNGECNTNNSNNSSTNNATNNATNPVSPSLIIPISSTEKEKEKVNQSIKIENNNVDSCATNTSSSVVSEKSNNTDSTTSTTVSVKIEENGQLDVNVKVKSETDIEQNNIDGNEKLSVDTDVDVKEEKLNKIEGENDSGVKSENISSDGLVHNISVRPITELQSGGSTDPTTLVKDEEGKRISPSASQLQQSQDLNNTNKKPPILDFGPPRLPPGGGPGGVDSFPHSSPFQPMGFQVMPPGAAGGKDAVITTLVDGYPSRPPPFFPGSGVEASGPILHDFSKNPDGLIPPNPLQSLREVKVPGYTFGDPPPLGGGAAGGVSNNVDSQFDKIKKDASGPEQLALAAESQQHVSRDQDRGEHRARDRDREHHSRDRERGNSNSRDKSPKSVSSDKDSSNSTSNNKVSESAPPTVHQSFGAPLPIPGAATITMTTPSGQQGPIPHPNIHLPSGPGGPPGFPPGAFHPHAHHHPALYHPHYNPYGPYFPPGYPFAHYVSAASQGMQPIPPPQHPQMPPQHSQQQSQQQQQQQQRIQSGRGPSPASQQQQQQNHHSQVNSAHKDSHHSHVHGKSPSSSGSSSKHGRSSGGGGLLQERDENNLQQHQMKHDHHHGHHHSSSHSQQHGHDDGHDEPEEIPSPHGVPRGNGPSPEPKVEDSEFHRSQSAIFLKHWNRGDHNSCARTDLTFKPVPDSKLARKREERLRKQAEKERDERERAAQARKQPSSDKNRDQNAGKSLAMQPPSQQQQQQQQGPPHGSMMLDPSNPYDRFTPRPPQGFADTPALRQLSEYARPHTGFSPGVLRPGPGGIPGLQPHPLELLAAGGNPYGQMGLYGPQAARERMEMEAFEKREREMREIRERELNDRLKEEFLRSVPGGGGPNSGGQVPSQQQQQNSSQQSSQQQQQQQSGGVNNGGNGGGSSGSASSQQQRPGQDPGRLSANPLTDPHWLDVHRRYGSLGGPGSMLHGGSFLYPNPGPSSSLTPLERERLERLGIPIPTSMGMQMSNDITERLHAERLAMDMRLQLAAGQIPGYGMDPLLHPAGAYARNPMMPGRDSVLGLHPADLHGRYNPQDIAHHISAHEQFQRQMLLERDRFAVQQQQAAVAQQQQQQQAAQGGPGGGSAPHPSFLAAQQEEYLRQYQQMERELKARRH